MALATREFIKFNLVQNKGNLRNVTAQLDYSYFQRRYLVTKAYNL